MLVATAVAAPSRSPARRPTTHQAAAAEAAALQSQLAEARVELSAREARLVALQGQLTAAEEGLQRQRQVRWQAAHGLTHMLQWLELRCGSYTGAPSAPFVAGVYVR